MNLLSILLQAAPEATEQGGLMGKYSGIIMMVLIFVVFYFFLIRPQTKRQKEIKNQRESMRVGDRVVTSGGIYGKIKEMKENNIVIIEIAENVRIKVDKNSVFPSADDIQTAAK
jgi:preprotein translocase, YajC subunit